MKSKATKSTNKNSSVKEKSALDESNSGSFPQVAQLQTKKNSKEQTNKNGLPDQLQSGVANLSGMDMKDVKVHYNADQPAQLQAQAYAQGTDITSQPEQKKHLPNEEWHIVQQKQGKIKPTK
ncbi:DUF4157 domain-containing protein [Flavobacterium sp.]|uniref:eCIS core domain-containing protein n=1 Tax=Flavobacterium sp. TaxID=239 RepID=UPI0026211939|nr:DUF4157 domain-containing protein [Flavobacterium sp.]